MRAALPAVLVAAVNGVRIGTVHKSEPEMGTAAGLQQLLGRYDLTKYLFTRKVTIKQRAVDHAFPALTLTARFAGGKPSRFPVQHLRPGSTPTILRDDIRIARIVEKHHLRLD